MRRCSRCVFPETVPGIDFDANGVCSFCRSYRPLRCLGEAALLSVIESLRTGEGRYDCVVPISGGRDSTYVLYLAAAQYKLRVLAVNYDHEFRVEQAEKNIDAACQILNVDLIRIRSNWSLGQKIVRDGVRMSVPYGFKVLRPFVCTACGYGYRSAAYRAAEQHNVPLIFWGESDVEDTQDMENAVRAASGVTGFRRLVNRFRRLSTPAAYKWMYYSARQRSEFPFSHDRITSGPGHNLHYPAGREIRVYNYIPWDRNKIKETITSKLGWQKPAEHQSTWRFDCVLHSLVNYEFVMSFGCSKDCFGYCRMINSGRMTREEALEREEWNVAHHTEGIRQLLEEKVGLSRREVDKLSRKDGVVLP